jgi:ABC-type dipeptide/oligopeptide/nickel transport system permease component
LGTRAAVRRGTRVDSTVMGISQLGVSIPLFWSGLIMIFFFSLTLGWLPAPGVGRWRRLLLPESPHDPHVFGLTRNPRRASGSSSSAPG